MSDYHLKDSVAIVIGGASGIGAAIAREAAKKGARVVIADINKELALETISSIKAAYEPTFIDTDVTKTDQIRQMVKQAASLGKIHFLANSAGIQTYGTVETTSEEDWDLTMDINLKSMFLVCKEVIPQLRENGGGSIVNISSVQGIRCQHNVLAYSTAKAAAIALTRSISLDHAMENITTNCICPGSVDTPLLRYGAAQHGPVEEVLKEWGSKHPIGRIGEPEEIAKLTLYLWSQDAKFMVGQPIVMDGGLSSIVL